MAVSTLSRCVPSAGPTSVSKRASVHAPTSRPVSSFVRPNRQRSVSAAAGYRTGGWNDGSADAMVNLMNDVAKAWKSAQTNTGYDYNRGRCNPYKSSSNSNPNPNRKPSLPYDVIQTDSSYQLFVDIPGLAKPDLKIRVSNPKSDKVQGSSFRVLSISGERQAPLQEGYAQKQRLFGCFENTWQLPADAESDGINAKVTDGVLTVTVPKKQQQPEVDDSQEIFVS